jgi:hypothetical protein
MLAMALFGALVVFAVRGTVEHLLAGLEVSTRITFLMWMLLSAAVAVVRLPRVEEALQVDAQEAAT